jgi:hypothetical protein
LHLESSVYTESGVNKVFDASLRITGNGASASLVTPGAVIIERDVSLYRAASGNAPSLFAFASPFTNQYSGYFAGNWVRHMLEDTGYHNHVEYVYGNKPNASKPTEIAREQYIIDPKENFVAGKGHLIKMQTSGFNYGDLALPVTGVETGHSINKLVFNGSAYGLQPTTGYAEQLFAENSLPARTVPSGKLSTTVNWVIGNSYSSSLDVKEITKYLLDHPTLYVYTQLYVFLPGSQTWQPYNFTNGSIGSGGPVQLISLTDIPSQSLFMVRLSSNSSDSHGGGSFDIPRSFQTHGTTGNNLRSGEEYHNEILFRLTPESNPNLYDLAVVGLRSQPEGSVEKVVAPRSDAFHVYTLSGSNAQSINVQPEATESVVLGVRPFLHNERYTLTASRVESLQTAGVWLEDLLTRQTIDLTTTSSYTFDMDAEDFNERFVVHFTAYAPTGINETDNFFTGYYSNGEIVIKGLNSNDLGSHLTVTDMQGRTLLVTEVNNAPELRVPFTASEGVYIVQLKGARNLTLKFKK